MTREAGRQFASPNTARYWRDELNFAEFPLAALDKKSSAQSLVFEDRIFDQSTRSWVFRKLTVSPSREFGLPTALDEEVLLGLVQLTAKGTFAGRRLHFTRYELIDELGWDRGAKSYRRIDTSLRKWTGVTLYYDNAWWSKAEQAWVSEHFHVIDRATLLDRERRSRRVKSAPEDPNAGKSSVVWNELVFNSFEAGYLKKLDFEFLRNLRTPTSKRVYRFLDKRFYKKDRWSVDLRVFACEHIGLSKSYSNSKLRERLGPAISELESKGFLAHLPAETRFEQVRRGDWRVHLAKEPKRGDKARGLSKGTPPKRPQRQEESRAVERFSPAVWAYMESLAPDERSRVEEEAIQAAPESKRKFLKGLRSSSGRGYRTFLDALLESHLRPAVEAA